MPAFAELIQQGSAQAWLFIPSAVLLGVLHGLEPGHSKTMMAAFIVAIRGTMGQAVLLGLAATVSHTIIVWAIALGGMYLWRDLALERLEPWFQLAAGLIVIGIALWIVLQTRAQPVPFTAAHAHAHHGHHGDHRHAEHAHGHAHDDAHGRAHAAAIRRRFPDRSVTTGQIALFGLTGGLIPCPAAITVLLVCLQLREIPLGAALVLSFSIGLAITLVAVGAVAAYGVGHVARRAGWFSAVARWAPYASSLLVVLVGIYMSAHGLSALLR